MSTFNVRRYRDIVYVIYSHDRKRYRKSTRIKVEDKFWNEVTTRVRGSHPNAKAFNEFIDSAIQKLIKDVSAVIYTEENPSIDNLQRFLQKKQELIDCDFFQDYDRYIIAKGAQMTAGSLKNNRQTYNLCKAYADTCKKTWDVKTLDKEFFGNFLNYQLVCRNLLDATVQGHVKRLKSFMRYMYPDFNRDILLYKPSINFDDTIIYLYESELKILMEAELQGSKEKIRDLFIFCSLTGMRYGDSQRYTTAWEDQGMLEYRAEKTGGKAYPPLYDDTKRIVDYWGGAPPKVSGQKYNVNLKKLFEFLELERQVPVIVKKFDNSTRGYKLVEEHRKLYEVITSHVARKTFISNALIAGIKIQDVMKMSGHSDYRAIRPYIALSKKHLLKASRLWKI